MTSEQKLEAQMGQLKEKINSLAQDLGLFQLNELKRNAEIDKKLSENQHGATIKIINESLANLRNQFHKIETEQKRMNDFFPDLLKELEAFKFSENSFDKFDNPKHPNYPDYKDRKEEKWHDLGYNNAIDIIVRVFKSFWDKFKRK